jgi:hypothetical protein
VDDGRAAMSIATWGRHPKPCRDEVEERCSIVDIVEHLEKRSKAEALIPIRSGTIIRLPER